MAGRRGKRLQPVRRHFGMPDHGANDVVEVVRDAAGEGTQRLQPSGTQQPGAQLGTLLRGDPTVQRIPQHFARHAEQAQPTERPACRRPGAVEAEQPEPPPAMLQCDPGPPRNLRLRQHLPHLARRQRCRDLAPCRPVRRGQTGHETERRIGPVRRRGRHAGRRPSLNVHPRIAQQQVGPVCAERRAKQGQRLSQAGGHMVRRAADEARGNARNDVFQRRPALQRPCAGAELHRGAGRHGKQQQCGCIQGDLEPPGHPLLVLALGVCLGLDPLQQVINRHREQLGNAGVHGRQQPDEHPSVAHQRGQGLLRRARLISCRWAAQPVPAHAIQQPLHIDRDLGGGIAGHVQHGASESTDAARQAGGRQAGRCVSLICATSADAGAEQVEVGQ